jgi:hypothetical protein
MKERTFEQKKLFGSKQIPVLPSGTPGEFKITLPADLSIPAEDDIRAAFDRDPAAAEAMVEDRAVKLGTLATTFVPEPDDRTSFALDTFQVGAFAAHGLGLAAAISRSTIEAAERARSTSATGEDLLDRRTAPQAMSTEAVLHKAVCAPVQYKLTTVVGILAERDPTLWRLQREDETEYNGCVQEVANKLQPVIEGAAAVRLEPSFANAGMVEQADRLERMGRNHAELARTLVEEIAKDYEPEQSPEMERGTGKNADAAAFAGYNNAVAPAVGATTVKSATQPAAAPAVRAAGAAQQQASSIAK